MKGSQMLLARQEALEASEAFFEQIPCDGAAALQWSAGIIECARQLPHGIGLLVGCNGFVARVVDTSAEELAGLIGTARLPRALSVAQLMHRIAGEVRRRDYLLDELADELGRMPASSSTADEQIGALINLCNKGFRLEGLPAEIAQARQAILDVANEAELSLEYVLGNLKKAAVLLKHFGVRDETINASALFHNYMSGFLELDLGKAGQVSPAELASRAAALANQGTCLKVFRNGDFNHSAAQLGAGEIEALARETGESYGASEELFRRFLGALLSQEEARLQSAPRISLTEMLQTFPFSASDRDLVSAPPKAGDPTRWRESVCGRALAALEPKLDWVAVSAGAKAAGDWDAVLKNSEFKMAARALREQAMGCPVTVVSGRDGVRREARVGELAPEDLLFDLYCLAVLQRRGLGEVLEAANHVLGVLKSLGHPVPSASLGELASERLSGQSYAHLLGTHGLVLGSPALAEALARLKALADKVHLTIEPGEGQAVAVARSGLEEFRKAVIRMSRLPGVGDSPERVLALLRDRIAPEIKKLPKAVIAAGEHSLGRLVELAAAGVPARYALRRPWKRINLDPLTYMGSCLEPGIRNCLGCPVNSLYGLVTKTALASGFEDLITYEATGCFEVYSGIWPYTGKKKASLHGVFGGAPSELLGGLAARKARLKYAHKIDGDEGAAYRAGLKRTLHLGWGGDGATFDIGFGNLSGLFSRLQKLSQDDLDRELDQRALFVCYDNEGYQNTGNQYSAASTPGGNTTTNPRG